MDLECVKLDELILPDWNPRTISDKDMEKLKNSIDEFGYVAPLIVNRHNNHIVGGNQRAKALMALGYTEVDVVFIDEPDINKEKALNIALNKISGDWDNVKLEDILQELSQEELDLTGFDAIDLQDMDIDFNFDNFEAFNENNELIESKYSNKIDIPHYEITGKKPEISELVDTSKTLELQEKIINSGLSDDIQKFLINASYRFLEFNYSNIAEYYAHADKELQEIMEDLALVIIDFNKAIADGYVEFSEKMKEIVERDYGDLDE